MRKTILAIGFGSLLLAGTAAFGTAAFAGDSQSPMAQPVSTASLTNEKTCRFGYHDGTLIHTVACHTPAEWRDIRSHNQAALLYIQQRSLLFGRH